MLSFYDQVEEQAWVLLWVEYFCSAVAIFDVRRWNCKADQQEIVR